MENLREYTTHLVLAIISAVVSAGVWLVRTILTDSKRLSLLEQRQDMQHKEMVEALTQTQEQVSQVAATASVTTLSQVRIAEILERIERKEGQK